MNKKVVSLFLLYVIPFVFSACVCNCNKRAYERQYTGVELSAWDTSGFRNEEITDAQMVSKNTFGLSFYINENYTEITSIQPTLDFSSLGFASAYALSCDCLPDDYTTLDPLNSIVISVINTENQEETIVTSNFEAYNFEGNLVTANELFAINQTDDYWYPTGYQLDLVTVENIPNVAIFKVKIVLDSGAELIQQTNEIHFEI